MWNPAKKKNSLQHFGFINISLKYKNPTIMNTKFRILFTSEEGEIDWKDVQRGSLLVIFYLFKQSEVNMTKILNFEKSEWWALVLQLKIFHNKEISQHISCR